MSKPNNPATGRPESDGHDAVETLTDPELEAELTVASHDPVRRAVRFDRLIAEWLEQHRSRKSQPQRA